ncbi:MAG: preprotein translocase subunit SecE [Puniceicoccaceae bacterium]
MKNPFTAIRRLWNETGVELKKVSWPSQRELRQSTVVVIVGIALMGVFIYVSDYSLQNWIEMMTEWVRPTVVEQSL